MNIKQLLPFLCLSIIFYQCTSTQDSLSNNSNPNYGVEKPNFEDGKCYAKSMIPDQYEIYADEYPVYIGTQSNKEVDIETIEVVLQPASSTWQKKKADINCQSADPNDCLVWCLVETPAVTETITVLRDTTQSSDYEIKRISKKELLKKGGHTEWREVIYQNQITTSLVHQIQQSLRTAGYFNDENTRIMNSKTKASLTKFQKDNHLPVGQLDFETLDFLGIETNF